ncbi:[Fe-Fe] hydrogenase large subunit C-terminal domain-containing protein [Serpentinicella sp. ANB-PHB4]|uniref:[Fe-Fe] hydrogenase large subunit C-terminal domain-containing protein n=1 Tax=Serpentinicella sp. ANB-PHB4 TaxID=3074076 RepID=UPI002864B527|nr:[Fe-Fe] hydrogenase large subunit C-terminal domain-containing protein [Serpentinicella sp. ANB-PHB4]MDR5658339.1 [Fe-Fe] hydrogenase large subunit C-terminal domain-containing protein [Serpentinicella sp. ANB-PHB4]
MRSLIHSISLDADKCKGCTNCMKRCPTEAIRVKNSTCNIIDDRCINCGHCIHVCQHNALTCITDELEKIFDYRYRIALIDPVIYSQFDLASDPKQILPIFKLMGFSDIFEISKGADIITSFTKKYINKKSIDYPIISSSCPTVIRLIQLRFPELIKNILPIDSPVEISASIARSKAVEGTDYNDNDIGIFYISPCSARFYSFQHPVGRKHTNVTGTISINSLFLKMSKVLESSGEDFHFYPSGHAIGWARAGGQSQALEIDDFLAVDGIENVISVLEEIENNKINDLLFLECQACTNGCVGGCLTVENSFVARNRIRKISQQYYNFNPKIENIDTSNFLLEEPIIPLNVLKLDKNLLKAIEKMKRIDKVLDSLPKIDCGACGSPSCKALAEDIVLGFSKHEDCIIHLKRQVKNK